MMIAVYLIVLHTWLISASANNESYITRIYSNLAEVIRPVGKLPLEFSDEDWSNVRAESITLLGENLTITSQTITEKKKVLDGTEIYIRSPLTNDKTSAQLIKAILIDETYSTVKVQDDSIINQTALYFTVSPNLIFHIEKPAKPKYHVDFTYTNTGSPVFVSYLQSNLNWRTEYQLNLDHNDRDVLIAMANIRNDGNSAISIDQAELICGDINLRSQSVPTERLRKYRSNLVFTSSGLETVKHGTFTDLNYDVVVEQGKELAGLYVFPINKPFTIDGKTDYLLPMFRPGVIIERYGLISTTFSKYGFNGNAQRSYRLISDQYLSNGNCIIREYDRIVGETTLPNLAAKDKYEFSLGIDADIIYKENSTLISSNYINETESDGLVTIAKVIQSSVTITRTRYIYKVHLQMKNFKNRSVNIKYEQKGSYGCQSFKLVTIDQHLFMQDGSLIKSNMTLKANTVMDYTYDVELII